MIKTDFLPQHENIKIYQDDEMFKINTDTMVLGEYLEVYRDDTVLDIGTNTGALLLYASLFKPKRLIGIDINAKALKLAEENLKMNCVENYELHLADANNYFKEEVDVIICNPPYFKSRDLDKSNNKYLLLAKHEDNLPLENLIKTIFRNLKTNGKLYMLFQTTRLYEFLSILEKYHLTVKSMKFVYDKNNRYSNVFMVKAVKCAKAGMTVEKPVIIKRQENDY